MGRYSIREKGTRTTPIEMNIFDLDSIKNEIALLHFYDAKLGEISKYEVYDNKLKKIIWEEK